MLALFTFLQLLIDTRVLLLGAILRAILVIYAMWHDANLPVRYTDADYFVFRDAAALVAVGSTPYARATFRYPPLVAWLLAPGESLGIGAVWGKVLFCAADVGVGALLIGLLIARGETRSAARRASALWLLSPLAATAASRGSSDALALLFVLAALHGVDAARRGGNGRGGGGSMGLWEAASGGVALGAAIYSRLFPIIYALPLALALGQSGIRVRMCCGLLSPSVIVLTVATIATALILTASGIAAYGTDALTEAYYFHLSRVDARHNFSPLWYATYLASAAGGPGAKGPLKGVAVIVSTTLATLIAPRDLHLAVLIGTLAFVTLNAVVTAQYFNWWAALLPLVATRSRLSFSAALTLGAMWWGTELAWLFWAYKLEFKGEPVHGYLAGASLAFFMANVVLTLALLLYHDWDMADAQRLREEEESSVKASRNAKPMTTATTTTTTTIITATAAARRASLKSGKSN